MEVPQHLAARPAPLPVAWTPVIAPLCAIYGSVVRARAWLYKRGLLRARWLDRPVISVGNLTAGGSGKTPVVECLARQAMAAGLRPVVLTRGHGRAGASDLITVRGVAGSLASPESLGDEPYWLASRNPELPICIGRGRFEAGRLAQVIHRPDLFLLDDGFQHLALGRQLNLLLIDAGRGLGNGRVLPCGWLREPVRAARRADALIITQANLGNVEAVERALAARLGTLPPLFRCAYRPLRLTRLDGQATLPPEALGGLRLTLACAIARPESFAAAVRALGATVEACIARPDHDPYGASALAELERRLGRAPSDRPAWLTTEKDAVKLRGRLSAAERLWVLEMGVEPDPAWAAFFADFLASVGPTGATGT